MWNLILIPFDNNRKDESMSVRSKKDLSLKLECNNSKMKSCLTPMSHNNSLSDTKRNILSRIRGEISFTEIYKRIELEKLETMNKPNSVSPPLEVKYSICSNESVKDNKLSPDAKSGKNIVINSTRQKSSFVINEDNPKGLALNSDEECGNKINDSKDNIINRIKKNAANQRYSFREKKILEDESSNKKIYKNDKKLLPNSLYPPDDINANINTKNLNNDFEYVTY